MYEIGDKVIYQGADKSAYKKVGVLKSIEEKDGKPQLTVEFEGGETFTAPVDDWSKEFTNACKNAEFKVGDKVIVKGKIVGSKQHDGEVGVVKSIAGTGQPGDPVTVEVHYGPNATWKSGDVVYASPSILKLANSRAANAKFKVGDKVELLANPHAGIGKVVGVTPVGTIKAVFPERSGDTVSVFLERDLRLANSCRSTNSVVRNAMAANRRMARNGESEQREIVEMNIDSLKKDLDKVVRGLDETKRWMGKYGDNRIASIDKAKGAVVQAIQQLKY